MNNKKKNGGKMSSLLNRKATKNFILKKIAALRPGMESRITRVSSQALDDFEARLKASIEFEIMRHPSIGKTFRTN